VKFTFAGIGSSSLRAVDDSRAGCSAGDEILYATAQKTDCSMDPLILAVILDRPSHAINLDPFFHATHFADYEFVGFAVMKIDSG
jgi:hypothetical protein